MNATTGNTTNAANDIERLKTVLNHNPDDLAAVVSLGNIYFDLGEAAQAIVYYSYALRIKPDQPEVWTDMGTMYWRNNDINLAEKAFREAIANDASFGNAYVNLGLLLHRAKDNLAEARVVWQQLLTNNPNHPAAAKARELMWETATPVNN